ncbi:MAG: hypothetical protein Q9227_003430 [Pyrenula ochraceoflavens]
MIRVEPGNLDDIKFEDDWTPPTPSFYFPEHERIADAFFRPTAETLTGDAALARQIQVIHDLVTFCGLREPPKRGPRLDWCQFEEEITLDEIATDTNDSSDDIKSEDSSPADELMFPTDECMWCAGDHTLRLFRPRKNQRPDAFRRHFENQHLSRFSATESVECPHKVCQKNGVPPFRDRVV